MGENLPRLQTGLRLLEQLRGTARAVEGSLRLMTALGGVSPWYGHVLIFQGRSHDGAHGEVLRLSR